MSIPTEKNEVPEAVYARAIRLLEAEVGDELMALDAEGGTCFGFNRVATEVWRLLESPKSFDELMTSLLEEYEVDVERCGTELRELLDDLEAKGLIRHASR